ncbi:MAG: HAMP domain-containing protein [Planctomycetales bacterium]|nr:HAMP domain-containing protein [Planctomycetales bacterium]
MIRSSLFWKLFLIYAVLTTVSMLVVTTISTSRHELYLSQSLNARLRDVTAALAMNYADAWSQAEPEKLARQVRSLSEKTRLRLTIVDTQGTVIADSDSPPEEMNNHATRPEFVEARESGSGTSERQSPTLRERMRYHAQSVKRDGQLIGYVRSAVSVAEIDASLRRQRREASALTFVISAIVLMGTYWAVRGLLLPVQRLTLAADEIARTGSTASIHVPSTSELAPLAIAFNNMIDNLRTRDRQQRESTELLSTVLGGMTEGVLAIDQQRKVLFANSAVGKAFGFSPRDSQGKTLAGVTRNVTLRRVVEESFAPDYDHGDTMPEIELPGAPARVVAVNATQLPGDPCPGLVIVFHDVTQLRHLEQMRQQFVANVSHELKTPLSSIKIHAETLAAGAIDDPEVNRQFLAEIEEQAERLHQLILDMLQLARIEAGHQAIELLPVSVRDVVDDSVQYHANAAERKAIELVVDESDKNVHVSADHESLQQIIDNLVDNAIKYSPEHRAVHIGWMAKGSVVDIYVRDEGLGIHPADQERIFERFYRVDKARSREMGSTGLGLSIVKHLTRALGGSISITSQLGQGSTFTVRLPVHQEGRD